MERDEEQEEEEEEGGTQAERQPPLDALDLTALVMCKYNIESRTKAGYHDNNTKPR